MRFTILKGVDRLTGSDVIDNDATAGGGGDDDDDDVDDVMTTTTMMMMFLILIIAYNTCIPRLFFVLHL